jgi:hypothetical protein
MSPPPRILNLRAFWADCPGLSRGFVAFPRGCPQGVYRLHYRLLITLPYVALRTTSCRHTPRTLEFLGVRGRRRLRPTQLYHSIRAVPYSRVKVRVVNECGEVLTTTPVRSSSFAPDRESSPWLPLERGLARQPQSSPELRVRRCHRTWVEVGARMSGTQGARSTPPAFLVVTPGPFSRAAHGCAEGAVGEAVGRPAVTLQGTTAPPRFGWPCSTQGNDPWWTAGQQRGDAGWTSCRFRHRREPPRCHRW